MSAAGDVFVDKVVDAIADERPIDWSVADDTALGQETLDALKVVDGVRLFWGRHLDEGHSDLAGDAAAPQASPYRSDRATASWTSVGTSARDASLGDVLAATGATRQIDARTAPDISSGQSWGPLILLEYLGGGAFGEVYRAWDPDLQRIVALKRTRYANQLDAARARRELQNLAGIPRNQHVITVHGTCTVDDQVGIWMEFLPGRTLRRLLKIQGRLSWEEAALHGIGLCRALQHVHNAKLLHRDLKTENVMKAADDGRIVLIDFGSSQPIVSNHAPATERLEGTLPFMAPELFRSIAATPQSDLYSLGVMLFNLVTGRYPVEGTSLQDFERAHAAGRRVGLWDVRADLPKRFVDVVERATSPDAGRRYRTAGELLSALAALRDDLSLEPGAAPQTPARKAAWAALGALSLAAGMGMVTTRFFNAALGRSEFTNEGLSDYVIWGAKALVMPVVLALATVLGLTLCTGCRRLLVDRWPAVRALDLAIGRWARRFRLDDVETVSLLSLLGSILALVANWWYFVYQNPVISKFIAATYPSISTAPGSALAFLAPQFVVDHQRYTKGFTTVILVSLVLWYPTVRLVARRGASLNRAVAVGGLLVVVLALLLDFPYRLVAPHARRFQQVNWDGAHCYLLGERQVDLLLFCPGSAAPRNKAVRKSDPRVEITNEEGDLFAEVSSLK